MPVMYCPFQVRVGAPKAASTPKKTQSGTNEHPGPMAVSLRIVPALSR
jgi:hypothetical protein